MTSSYLALFTFVCTDTFAQGLLRYIDVPRLPQVPGTEDTLAVLQILLERADIGLVNIVDENRGHGYDLSGASGHDGHEDEEEHGVLSSRAEQFLRHQGSRQTGRDVLVSEQGSSLGGGQAEVSQALTQSEVTQGLVHQTKSFSNELM